MAAESSFLLRTLASAPERASDTPTRRVHASSRLSARGSGDCADAGSVVMSPAMSAKSPAVHRGHCIRRNVDGEVGMSLRMGKQHPGHP